MQRVSEKSISDHPQLEGISQSPDRLGWLLADSLKNVLPDHTLVAIYMHLGCRHYRRAIAEALQTAVGTGTSIPDTLARAIAQWSDAYHGHPDQERLIALLATVTRETRDEALWPATEGVPTRSRDGPTTS